MAAQVCFEAGLLSGVPFAQVGAKVGRLVDDFHGLHDVDLRNGLGLA